MRHDVAGVDRSSRRGGRVHERRLARHGDFLLDLGLEREVSRRRRIERDRGRFLGGTEARKRGPNRVDAGRHRREAEPPVALARRYANALEIRARCLDVDAGKRTTGGVADGALDLARRRLSLG